MQENKSTVESATIFVQRSASLEHTKVYDVQNCDNHNLELKKTKKTLVLKL